jgi:ribonuclease J
VVATFSSSVYRMQVLVDLAVQFDRRVAFVGRSMERTSEIAQRLGFLKVPSGVQIRDNEVPTSPARTCCASPPARRASRRPRSRASPSTTTASCAWARRHRGASRPRAIPGNEKAIARTMSHVARRGAHVITSAMKHVHVSGHGSEEELKLVLSLVRPRYFVPVHGEYRQLAQHARIAKRVLAGAGRGVQVLLAQDGDIIQFDKQARASRTRRRRDAC